MENKTNFTDEQIVKALECCQTQYNRNCEECPYEKCKKAYISVVTCESEMRKDLLAFINRQKEKSEQTEKAEANFKKDINDGNIREITNDEFMKLKPGDSVYLKCGERFLLSEVIEPPFWNGDADEPGWEIETDDGFCDRYSIYVAPEQSTGQNDWSLEGILAKYFPDSEAPVAYTNLISLISDLQSLGVLSNANRIISRLDEIESGREY